MQVGPLLEPQPQNHPDHDIDEFETEIFMFNFLSI